MLDALIYLAIAALGCVGIWFFGFQRRERDWERISVLPLVPELLSCAVPLLTVFTAARLLCTIWWTTPTRSPKYWDHDKTA